MASSSGEGLEKLEDMIVRAAESTSAHARAARAAIGAVIFGQERVIERALITVLCGGHALLVGVPGLAKTKLVDTMGTVLGLDARRIQFTPDLMPSDIVGTQVFDAPTGRFTLRRGPVFTNILLADEVNRSPAKTQSALLEAMEERQATIDGERHALPEPFMTLATQNPIEYEGTFPLPEAQLDRFLMRVSLGYPTPEQQMAILDAQQYAHPIEALRQITHADELVSVQERLRAVYADPLIKQYIVQLVDRTRQHADVYLGASPRGALTLYRTAQARAAVHGRDYVIPDDVKALAPATLGHRIIISPAARIKGASAADILDELLRTTPVPGAKVR